jgi:DNA-directed RNA polymerase specialized sigma24 family protein
VRQWQGSTELESGGGGTDQQGLKERLATWHDSKAMAVAVACGAIGRTAVAASRDAIEDQIERGKLTPAEIADFRAHCEMVLRIHLALLELAQICRQGSESRWPSRHQATNADAWQNTYEKLAARISDGRVDIDRPLLPLARITAYRLMLSERRKQADFLALTDIHLHRFNLGEEVQPEESAESSRRAAALQEAFARLRREGRLKGGEEEMLRRRYVAGQTSAEVATSMGTTAPNIRQLCARRCSLLRGELGGQEFEEVPG